MVLRSYSRWYNWLGVGVLAWKNLKWSTLLVYIFFFFFFFCHFKTFYRHYHSKCCLPGPRNLDFNAFQTFLFSFLKNRCAHIFPILAPEWWRGQYLFCIITNSSDYRRVSIANDCKHLTGLGICSICKGFALQTFPWSLKFVTQNKSRTWLDAEISQIN